MNTVGESRLDRLCALLGAAPDYEDKAKQLKTGAYGALVAILPKDDDGHWQANLAELADKYAHLQAAGLRVLAVSPPPDGFDLPFTQVDIKTDLAEELWKTLRDLVTFRPFEYAAIVSPDSDRLKKDWSKRGPDRLVPEILAHLVFENRIPYTQDPEIIRIVERTRIEKRRAQAADEDEVSTPDQKTAYKNTMDDEGTRAPLGMAFSGGGIRAAAFSLGVTQALARYRFLPWLDYFSSVSGGGFTAANIVSILNRQKGKKHHFNTQWEKFPFNPGIEVFRTPDDLEHATRLEENRNYNDRSYRHGHNAQLKHLINQANYIIPRIGVASRDLLRGLGALLPGMGFTLLLFLLAVAAAAGLHFFAAGLAAPALFNDVELIEGANWTSTLFDGRSLGRTVFDLFLMGVVAGLLVYTFLVGHYSYPGPRPKQKKKADGTDMKPAEEIAVTEDADDENVVEEQEPNEQASAGRLRFIYALLLAGFLITGLAAWLFGWEINRPEALPPAFFPLPEPALLFFALSLLLALAFHGALITTSRQLARALAPDTRFGAVFPHPRGLVPLALLLLLQTGVSFFMIGGLLPAGWIYPAALATAGGLLLLLAARAFSDGIIAWRREVAAALILALVALGAGLLLLPGEQGLIPHDCGAGCLAWTVLPAAALLFALLALSTYRQIPADWGQDGLNRWERYDRWVLRTLALFMVGGMGVALVLARARAGDEAVLVSWVWAPAAFLAGPAAVFTMIRLAVTGKRITWGSPAFRTMIWAAIGMSVYTLGAALLFALLTVPHMLALQQMGETPGPAIPLGSAILSGLWAIFLARFSGKDTGGESLVKRLFALPAGIRNAALGVLVVVFWVSLVFLAEIQLDNPAVFSQPIQFLGVALAALGLLLLFGILLNYNYLSLHHFWGDRIVEVFLRTTAEDREGRIVTLRDETDYDLKSINQDSGSTPYHLVVTALNLAGSKHQRDRDRKSRHFIFSREFVGSDATGYVRTINYRGGKTKYGSTIALSGAAVSPGIGTFTFFAQSFMLTLFNIRLGQWWLNPRVYRRANLSGPDLDTYENQAFWPLYLMDEAFAATSARRRLVNITDGGHTRDNGGIYPLLERRCKIIIAADASQDEKGLCPDLFSALHYARIDFDVHVEIDVSGLQPAAESIPELGIVKGMSDAHLAVGRIYYPEVQRRDGSVRCPAEKGWLIYVKPAVSEEMPFDILQFWQTDPKMFPHPSTADQFFSERQLEAQRRLGEESIVRSLEILAAAYRDPQSGLHDPGGAKRRLLMAAIHGRQIDYRLLERRPGLVDVILRDLMRVFSPAAGEDLA